MVEDSHVLEILMAVISIGRTKKPKKEDQSNVYQDYGATRRRDLIRVGDKDK